MILSRIGVADGAADAGSVVWVVSPAGIAAV